jgi:hypothetical protein
LLSRRKNICASALGHEAKILVSGIRRKTMSKVSGFYESLSKLPKDRKLSDGEMKAFFDSFELSEEELNAVAGGAQPRPNEWLRFLEMWNSMTPEQQKENAGLFQQQKEYAKKMGWLF